MFTKRKLAFLFFLCAFLGLGAVAVHPVLAQAQTERIYGNDKYQTAVAVSRAGWPDGTATAVLAYGENFPDALCATPLAAKYKAPILLTGKSALNADTAAELTRLGVKQVYIVGGTAVVSENVENKLKQMGIKTTRYAGEDMYETSVKVAKVVGTANGVIVTGGGDFADSVSVAPIAAHKSMPVVLIPKDKLTKPLSDFFKSIKKGKSYFVGNERDFSNAILQQLPSVQFIGGSDRYQRNVNVLNFFSADLDLTNLYIATGQNFADSLAATSLAQKNSSAVLLVGKDSIPAAAQRFVSSNVINDLAFIGGYAAISNTVEQQLSVLPASITYLYDVNVEVYDNAKYEIPSTVTALRSDGARQEVPVTWDLSSLKFRPGVQTFEGIVNGVTQKATLVLTIKPTIASLVQAADYVYANSEYVLPKTVYANMTDGTGQEVPVIWNIANLNISKPGTYALTGKVDGTSLPAKLSLTVRPEILSIQPAAATFGYMNNTDYDLPDKVKVNLSDGTTEDAAVVWNMTGVDFSQAGVYSVWGVINGTTLTTELSFTVKPAITSLEPAYTVAYANNNKKYTTPEKIKAHLADGTVEDVAVTWDTANVNVTKPGSYDITGKVRGTSLPASLRVTVKPGIASLEQAYGSVFVNSNGKYTVPETVKADLTDGTTADLAVTWDTANLNVAKAGVYNLTGKVGETSIVAKLKFTVKSIVSLEQAYGSTYANPYGEYALPAKVKANLADKTAEDVAVTWNVGSLNVARPGTYAIKGTIEDSTLTASLIFTVKSNITSLDQAYASVYANPDGKYTVPEKVRVHLADGTAEDAAVTWNLTGLNVTKPGVYDITGKVIGTSIAAKLSFTVKPGISSIQQAYVYVKANSSNSYTLPDQVWVILADGTWDYAPVQWDAAKLSVKKVGTYDLIGTVENSPVLATLKVIVYQ